MTLEDYIAKLATIPQAYKDKLVEAVFIPAATEFLAEIKNRIVLDGKKTNEAPTGTYSTRPAYFGPEAYFKQGFQPKGKNGNATHADGTPYKTEYFPSGYKGLRDKQGLPTDRMTLSYTGGTLLAFQMHRRGEDVVIGFTNEKAAKRRKDLEIGQKRGPIFSGSADEKKRYSENVAKAEALLLSQFFK